MSTPAPASIPDQVEAIRDHLGWLQMLYRDDDPAYWALGLAWEAAVVAHQAVERAEPARIAYRIGRTRSALDDVTSRLGEAAKVQ